MNCEAVSFSVASPNETAVAISSRRGFAKRNEDYLDHVLRNHAVRQDHAVPEQIIVMKAVNYLHIPEGPRHLLNQLVTHINYNQEPGATDPATRFLVFPGNLYLTLALGKNERTIQRYALQLEELGLVTRCYNAINTRVGFDLSGFVSAAAQICKDFEADIATMRKTLADKRQLELLLGDIPHHVATMRPEHAHTAFAPACAAPTRLSPRDDKIVTHNNKNRTKIESSICSGVLGLVDLAEFARHSSVVQYKPSVGGDDIVAQSVLSITRLMQNSHGQATAPWRNAVVAVGQEYATALWLTAELDPMRKGAIAQYFAFLAHHVSCPSKSGMITAAVARAQSAITKKSTADAYLTGPVGQPPARASTASPRPARSQPTATRPQPSNPVSAPAARQDPAPAADNAPPTPLAANLIRAVNADLAKRLSDARAMRQVGDILFVQAKTQFAASYLEANYARDLRTAAAALDCGIEAVKILRPEERIPRHAATIATPVMVPRPQAPAPAAPAPNVTPSNMNTPEPCQPTGIAAQLLEIAHGPLVSKLLKAKTIRQVDGTLYIDAHSRFDACALRANFMEDLASLCIKLDCGITTIEIVKNGQVVPASPKPVAPAHDEFGTKLRAAVPAECTTLLAHSTIVKRNDIVTITLADHTAISPCERAHITRAALQVAGPVLVEIQ